MTGNNRLWLNFYNPVPWKQVLLGCWNALSIYSADVMIDSHIYIYIYIVISCQIKQISESSLTHIFSFVNIFSEDKHE